MDTAKKTLWTILAAAALALCATLAGAQDIMHGRVSFADDGGLVKGPDDDDWSYAEINALVLPGDTLWADDEGVLEVELSGGTFIRLADASRVDVVATPPETLLRGWTGSFYVHRVGKSRGDVVFETPVAKINVKPGSQVRIDVLEDGPTTVSVRWGAASVETDAGSSVYLNSGERSYIDPGYLPSSPARFDLGHEDAFDSWNRDRARMVSAGSSRVPIARDGYSDGPIGMADLDGYGDWVYVDNQTYWKPTRVADYVPYRQGHWSYVPAQGYVWVGSHPFSYVTSHHGHWSHHAHHGWIWSYTHAYSPAYVYTVQYGDYFLWAPIDHHGHPVYHASSHFSIGGVHFSFGYSTYSHVDHILYGHHVAYSPYSHSIHHHHTDYHYWNLHSTHSPYHSTAQHHWGSHRTRDYTPRRVLRGREHRDGHTQSARERVARLQGRTHRTDFHQEGPRNVSRIRTARQPRDREASVRNVRVRSDVRQAPDRRDFRRPRDVSIGSRPPRDRGDRIGRDQRVNREQRVDRGNRSDRRISTPSQRPSDRAPASSSNARRAPRSRSNAPSSATSRGNRRPDQQRVSPPRQERREPRNNPSVTVPRIPDQRIDDPPPQRTFRGGITNENKPPRSTPAAPPQARGGNQPSAPRSTAPSARGGNRSGGSRGAQSPPSSRSGSSRGRGR